MIKLTTILLMACCCTLLAACESASDRQDRIEAAMNNGTATPDMIPEEVRRAQEESARREITAQTQLAPAGPLEESQFVPLLAPPPAVSKDPPSRAEVERTMAAEACRPDISPPDCAKARAALVNDFMSLANDGLVACQQLRVQILRLQHQLRSGTPDPVDFKFGASSNEIADLLAVKRGEFATGCTQSGDDDAPAEAYFKRQRDSVHRAVPR